MVCLVSCFNPRTRVGCDALQRFAEHRAMYGFNPRTRVGCDMIRSSAIKIVTMFQSTHPRGVRQAMMEHKQWVFSVSIHAPAWGATSRV